MHKKAIWKPLIAAACCIALLTGVFGVAQAGGLLKRSKAENTWQKLREENGFVFGINYPWLTGGLGNSLTSNELMVKYVGNSWGTPAIDVYGTEQLYRDFYNIKAMGYDVVGYWGSCYGEGVIYDDYGDVLGVKEEYLKNMRVYLDLIRKANLKVLWIVHAHSETISSYYNKECWDIVSQMYCNPEVTEHYVEKFVRPVCKVLADYKDVVALVSAGCEPENEINDDAIQESTHVIGDRQIFGVNKDAMLNFLSRINDTVKEELPDVGRTIASNSGYVNVYNDFDLEVIGRNQYSSSANASSINEFTVTAPMIITEWGVGVLNSEEQFHIQTIAYMEDIIDEGYDGSFFWCYLPEQAGNAHSLFNKGYASATDYRPMVYSMRYMMNDYRNEFHEKETILDAPVMLYQSGSGNIEWIASRQATSIDIQRTTDGGKTFTTLVTGGVPTDYETNYKGKYSDPNPLTDGEVAYRVVAHDDDGNTAIGEWSNIKEALKPAPELINNGGFENGTDGWQIWTTAKVDIVTDQVNSGEKAALFSGTAWSHLYIENIPVDKNSQYTLSYWYKSHPDNVGTGYCVVRRGGSIEDDDAGKQSTFLNNCDGEWHHVTKTVTTNDADKFCLNFYTDGGGKAKFYIDDVSLKKIQ